MAARRLLMFASSTAVDLDSGRVYPRSKFVDLLSQMLQTSRCLDKRAALSIIRDAIASAARLHGARQFVSCVCCLCCCQCSCIHVDWRCFLLVLQHLRATSCFVVVR